MIQTIKENKDWFTGTTLIMNNNSKWLGDDTPCLTYGLRGRLCFEVEVRVLPLFLENLPLSPSLQSVLVCLPGRSQDHLMTYTLVWMEESEMSLLWI
jgi:hypothetical protein